MPGTERLMLQAFMTRRRLVAALCLLLGAAAFGRLGLRSARGSARAAHAGQAVASRGREHGAANTAMLEPEKAACLEGRLRVELFPALPDVPLNGGPLRAALLGRAKAEPVLFLRRPEARGVSRAALALRAELDEAPGFQSFDHVVGSVRKSPELARGV